MKDTKAFFGSIRIHYDEPDPSTYESVEVYTRNYSGEELERKKFATGDANYDYHCGMIWLENAGCEHVTGSSSCDHFIMDGGIIDLEVPGLKERLREFNEELEKQQQPK
jgi:hypothetical protein